ncbi:MAG: beta-ketoacyl-[acyl-carrier-protein] synthase II, partial [Clostridiales bacterium]|nr:beta-ketoacyl-[acyl-carrier-protein] synthase II [Clostridiales bacterium]
GAAGAIEAIITVKSVQEGFVPPTINYREKDPGCDLDYVPNKGTAKEISYALSNSFGFGGHNAVLCFKKWEG